MDRRLLAAIFIASLVAGCLGGEPTPAAEGDPSPPPNSPQHTVLYVNGTLPASTAVCTYVCVGNPVMHETPLELTNTTVTQVDYQLVWDDPPPVCQHLRFQIFYEEELSWGGKGWQLVYTNGPSPLDGRVADDPLPLNNTLSLSVAVAVQENPDASPVNWDLLTQVEYSLRMDLEHRETLPEDGDWRHEPPNDEPSSIPPPTPSPYVPVCG